MTRFTDYQIDALEKFRVHIREAKQVKSLSRKEVTVLIEALWKEKSVSALFYWIEKDLKYLIGLNEDDCSRPAFTEIAKPMDFIAKLNHLDDLIEKCINGVEFDPRKMRLHYPETYKIQYQGSLVRVKEVTSKHDRMIFYKSEESDFFYFHYFVDRGLADVIGIYKLTKKESNDFSAGTLDLNVFYESLTSRF